jgi:hypothetical protein
MNEELNDKIDNYLKGKLNETELKAFENAMNSDEALAQAVQLSKLENDSIELLIEDDLRAQMSVWKQEKAHKMPSNTEGVVSPKNNKYFLFFGALIILILITLFYFLNKKENNPTPQINNSLPIDSLPKEEKTIPQNNSNPINNPPIVLEKKTQKPLIKKQEITIKKEDAYSDLAYSFYKDFDYSNEVRDLTTNNSNAFNPIIEAWQNNDFQLVITLCKPIDKNSDNYFISQEMSAHAYFKLNKFSEAANLFNSIANSAKGEIIEHANWYRLLCLIALHKNESATILLNQLLANKNAVHYSEAQALNTQWQALIKK